MAQTGAVSGLFRPQCVAGRRHVRPLPGRSELGQRQLARVLRRLPARPGPGPSGRCGAAAVDAGRPGRRRGRRRRRGVDRRARAAGLGRPTRPPSSRGAASRIVANMEASLGVPTATSVRTVPARLLEVNRQILNNQLARTTGAKVSFTHLIGYAIVRALHDVPALNAAFVDDVGGTGQAGRHPPQARRPRPGRRPGEERRLAHAARAVHQARPTPSTSAPSSWPTRTSSARSTPDKISPDDFAGTTVSLTNPGTLGTVQSVPRLMPGQGAIIGVGALGYPPGFEAADPRVLAQLGSGQGGHADLDLRPPHHPGRGVRASSWAGWPRCLTGADGFYDALFESMGVPYEPVRWQRRQQRRRGHRRGRAPAPDQAGARADADQHVPGAGPPDRPPRPARRRAARTSMPSSTR